MTHPGNLAVPDFGSHELDAPRIRAVFRVATGSCRVPLLSQPIFPRLTPAAPTDLSAVDLTTYTHVLTPATSSDPHWQLEIARRVAAKRGPTS